MFSHVTVGTNDLDAAKKFYDAVAKALGLARKADHPESVGYGPPDGRPQLWVLRPADKKTATAGNGITVGLEAGARSAVDAAYAAGLAAGGTDEGRPGLRKHYHPNYYGAYLRDPDGTKVCVVCHKPE